MDKKDDRDGDRLISRGALAAMLAVVLVLALVSIYANWQNVHRSRIESTTVIRFTPTPAPSTTP